MTRKKISATKRRRSDHDLVTMTIEVPRLFRAAVHRAAAISSPRSTQRAIILNAVLAHNGIVRSEYSKLRQQDRRARMEKGGDKE